MRLVQKRSTSFITGHLPEEIIYPQPALISPKM
jgi:hypothetical protein